MTIIPRWTAAPVEGSATYAVPVGPALRRAVEDLATHLRVPAGDVVLAAYLRVVGLLTGETEVSVGYGVPPDPVSADLTGGSWRELIGAVHDASPADFDPALVLGPDLSITYDTMSFDTAHIERIGGYLAAALEAITTDVDSTYDTADLISAAEYQHLIHERSGPARELPDARFHQLFAARAASHPDAVAVAYRGQTWTYDRLNRAANQIAHALLAEGLAAEEVVAVGTGRNPGWLAAIIGVFKAGGAYLPVETNYPPARVATLLEQSRCRLVVTGPGGLPSLAEIPSATALRVDELMAGPDHDPDVVVRADQLAYLYFTSGSTGLPKGAMCEHGGMVNHLLAKVDDFGLGPADVVVQNAEASFDISLWQLIAPLMVGGHTVIVPREEILDVRRFLDTIVEHDASVLQVVPSYLDVLLRATERQPRDLGRLRHVSVTGEAISKPLVNRFFAQYPGIRLINAYGATEASDDTTHEVMAGPPAEDLVPVGRPVRNVTVYILGPRDSLRPLGSPGEIVFSGICVGRGYANNPARTAEAFADDPFRPGERIYRTGDYGRWLPSGTLEFHGRRDEQVKINGIRIELGEVESRLLEHPRVRAASVIVVPLPGVGKSLVGFYTTVDGLTSEALRDHLIGVLPVNSVPARLHAIDALPLNANGKVDKRVLAARALAAPEPTTRAELLTETERRIAEVWATALDRPVDQIGRHDHFFELGGGSLSALRVVASLDGLISLDDMIRTPVLSEVAAAADGGPVAAGGLLRLLAGPAEGASSALVCVPYAAGTAITFQPLAAALSTADPTVAVYAVQPPGHDLSQPGEALLDVDELSKLLADEINSRVGTTPVALWGHCSGVPLVLACARRLPDVRHVFVAARLPESAAELSREIAAVVAAPDADLAAELVAQGDELAGLGLADRAFVGRVYRHDARTANQYLLAWDGQPITCPATVVIGTDDPLTPGSAELWAGWRRFAPELGFAEVPGGHLFHRTEPGAVAELIRTALSGDPS